MNKLKQLGLIGGELPTGAPDDRERKWMKETAQPEGPWDEIGKVKPMHGECGGCHAEKPKLKSGKFAKTNIDIKKQEQWPHMNVLRKYSKRTSFDNMDFELFMAGETRVISLMMDKEMAQGRLELLSKLAHWVCRCRDWTLVKGFYEGIIESVELGEANWTDDFSHYETMMSVGDVKREGEDYRPKYKDRKLEVFWCKPFQRNACQERAPHMQQMRSDELPVPVVHCCAYCLQKDNRREEHAEIDCVAKRGQ